jgi:fucose 4-O-acetylase-like acetyltransferase
MDKNRAVWIDMAKTMAIIAVIVDHMSNRLYVNDAMQRVSSYSVGMFVICMGATSYWSLNGGKTSKEYVKKRATSILGPYIMATVLCSTYYNRGFCFEKIINELIHFNASLPYYYVCLYLQLILITPVIIYYVARYCKGIGGIGYSVAGMLGLSVASYFLNTRTNILEVYGGGGKLFGGSYIVLLFVGVLLAHVSDTLSRATIVWKVVLEIVSILVTIFIACLLYRRNDLLLNDTLLGASTNPPGITIIVYSTAFSLLLFGLDVLISDRIPRRIEMVFTVVGRRTLSIFLYHMLLFVVLSEQIVYRFGLEIRNSRLRIVIYFGILILGSIILGYAFDMALKRIGLIWKSKVCKDE